MHTTTPRRRQRYGRRAGVLLLVAASAAAGALGAIVAIGEDGSTPPRTSASSTLTAAELRRAAVAAGVPVYWAGPSAGARYELRVTPTGAFVRYAMRKGAHSVTVATYPSNDSYARLGAAATRPGSSRRNLADGGLVVTDRARPTSVHLGYPGLGAQIEVFATHPADALQIVARGRVRPVATGTEAPVQPFVASVRDLRSIARAPGSAPIYWAGARRGTRLEVTRTSNGTVFVRYLPLGVEAGDRRPGLLTVASYPRISAFADVLAATNRPGARRFDVPGGAVGVLERGSRTNLHLAFPGIPRQIEVYGAPALDIVSLGRAGMIERVR